MKFLTQTMFLLVVFVLVNPASAEPVPHLINYQGKLTGADGSPLATGDYTLSFKIYKQASSGTAVWGPQTFTNAPVAQGHFNIILGQTDDAGTDIATAFTSDSTYLEITVNNGSPILPRQRILSAPYAVSSLNAEVARTVRGDNLYIDPDNGNIGVHTTQPQAELDLGNGAIANVNWANSDTGVGSGLIPDVIACNKTFTLNGDGNGYAINFSKEDCGGYLPDDSYQGAATKVHVCNGSITFNVVTAPPSVHFYAYSPCGSGGVGALYFKVK
ncbi:MAG: hypothetical protein GY862_14130 [Gammaproteobacteria bacterium]|nr:hypothetical protein [Gammaproteobacteria bacterium]